MTGEPLVLAPAEMAVIFQHLLGPSAGQSTGLLGDLNLAPDSLATARAGLLERGLLRPAPDRASRETFIAPHVRPIFAAATRPLMLAVLQIMRPGQPERGAYFSWTPDLLIYNTVDAQGNHRLEALASIDAIADRALAECRLVDVTSLAASRSAAMVNDRPPAGAATGPDALARSSTLRVVFMTIASARTAHEQVKGLVWLVSAGQLYLLTPQAAGHNGGTAEPATPAVGQPAAAPQARATPVGATQAGGTPSAPGDASLRALPLASLRAALVAAAHQAIDHTLAVLAAA